MSLLARLGRSRFAAEVRFVLGGALAGAAAGVPPSLLSAAATTGPLADQPLIAFTVTAARGFGIGWWAGLMWSIVLAVAARRSTPPPPVPVLARAAWLAASAVALGSFTAYLLGWPVSRGAVAGVAIGTLGAFLMLGWAVGASQS